MTKFEEQLQRTWVQLLADHEYRQIAAIALDVDITVVARQDEDSGKRNVSVEFNIPFHTYRLVFDDKKMKKVMERALASILKTQEITFDKVNDYELLGRYSDFPQDADFDFRYRQTLLEVEPGWKEKIKFLIVETGITNQGLISEKAKAKRDETPLTYNEMKFASKTEILIAQELENHKVLFFPLPLAVRSDTGNIYNDHREVDFLVCEHGVVGILEVSYHPNRFEQDSEKDTWFKKSGILCVQHYTAEKCHRDPEGTVREFLEILSKHRR